MYGSTFVCYQYDTICYTAKRMLFLFRIIKMAPVTNFNDLTGLFWMWGKECRSMGNIAQLLKKQCDWDTVIFFRS